jgi:transposase
VEARKDAGWMADCAKGKLQAKKRELTWALEGTFTVEQRWLLDRELRQVEWLEQQIQSIEGEIERRVGEFEEPIQRLLTIPGVDRVTAWTIVAEIGVDMQVFADAQHLASWAGLCPGNRESGGKRMSGRVRKANRYIKRALCQAAWAATRTKNTYLSAFYRRMCVRKGSPMAVMALAHHMAVIVYQILSRSEEYVEMGGDYYDQRNKPKVVARLVKRLSNLGYWVQLQPIESPSPQETEGVSIPTADLQPPPVSKKRRRGRPCKCAARGIICKHRTAENLNSLPDQSSSPA